jgi:hypothetical protein
MSTNPPGAAPASTPETRPEICRAERRLAILERLSGMALAMAHAVSDNGRLESADTSGKLSREAARIVALKAKLEAALAARRAQPVPCGETPTAQDADRAAFEALWVPRPRRLH